MDDWLEAEKKSTQLVQERMWGWADHKHHVHKPVSRR
jgi:hypothetical protein